MNHHLCRTFIRMSSQSCMCKWSWQGKPIVASCASLDIVCLTFGPDNCTIAQWKIWLVGYCNAAYLSRRGICMCTDRDLAIDQLCKAENGPIVGIYIYMYNDWHAQPFPAQGSHSLSSLMRACMIAYALSALYPYELKMRYGCLGCLSRVPRGCRAQWRCADAVLPSDDPCSLHATMEWQMSHVPWIWTCTFLNWCIPIERSLWTWLVRECSKHA